MKVDYLKVRKEFISLALLWFSAFLCIVMVVSVSSFFVVSARAEKLIENAVAQSRLDPNDMEKYFAKPKALADELKKKNLFASPPPKQHPVKQVPAILGDSVLINGKWYKVGDKVADAKVVAIEPTQVKIEWQGQIKTFAPLAAISAPEPKERPEKAAMKRRMRRKDRAAPVEKMPEEKVVASPPDQDPLAWMQVKLSPALREKLLKRWNNMSDEQKQRWKERWNSMSDEQKQKRIKMMEQNVVSQRL